jgi:hypothetical protein
LLPCQAGFWLLLLFANVLMCIAATTAAAAAALCCCCHRLSFHFAFLSFVQEDPIVLAVLPPDVLVGVLRQLPLSVRLRECSLVCRTWRAAAAAATDDLLVVPPTGSCNAAAFQSWMVQHGSNLKALTLNRASTCNWQPTQVQLPFSLLRSLTRLSATDANLLNLPFADAAGSSSTTSTSSGRSDNPLSALISLAELGLQHSRVLGAPGALQYLSALGASLTRLRLAYVTPK